MDGVSSQQAVLVLNRCTGNSYEHYFILRHSPRHSPEGNLVLNIVSIFRYSGYIVLFIWIPAGILLLSVSSTPGILSAFGSREGEREGCAKFGLGEKRGEGGIALVCVWLVERYSREKANEVVKN